MRETISVLMSEHKTILAELIFIEKCLLLRPDHFLFKILERLKTLGYITISEHHKREDEILFTWMLEQNEKSDVTIIDRIRSEHTDLELKQQEIVTNLQFILAGKANVSLNSLAFDVTEFINLYREHIEREESFIYLIAEGLLGSGHFQVKEFKTT